MVPLGVSGEIKDIKAGKFTIRNAIGVVKTSTQDIEIFLASKWKVRVPRTNLQKTTT